MTARDLHLFFIFIFFIFIFYHTCIQLFPLLSICCDFRCHCVWRNTRHVALSHFAVLVWVFRVHRCSPDESRKENEFCRCCLVVTGPVSLRLLLLGLFLCPLSLRCLCCQTDRQTTTHTHTRSQGSLCYVALPTD